MISTVTNPSKTFGLVALALASAAMGTYIVIVDDKPGSAILAFVLMLAAILLVVRSARGWLPVRAARIAAGIGVLVAAGSAFVVHGATVARPLFARPSDVPTASGSTPAPRWSAAVERARPAVRAAIVEQNLPGVSIAVGAGGEIVWAEGFGWRDLVTETPVTPETRFNIGTAARVIAAAPVASLGMADTGTDSAADWSPSHNGEPEDDPPPFTFVHDRILRPMGIAAPAQPLPGERATYYVPRSSDDNDPRRGRWLMYMRDLACCPGRTAFYSTPSDLVRFALATRAGSLDGELAGGSVVSLGTRPEHGIAVAVASNIAHADTAALAAKVADLFEQP